MPAIKNCNRCGDELTEGGPKRMYCLKEKDRTCPVCETEYTVICQSKDRAMPKTCSKKCQHLLAEQTRQGLRDSGDYAPMSKGYKIPFRNYPDRTCDGCGDTFTPTGPSQRYCADKSNPRVCLFCEQIFQPNRPCDIIEQVYCTLLCSTLGSGNSKLFKDKIDEYRNIDDWAIRFAEKERRKPNHVDVFSYFNIRTPSHLSRDLYDMPKRSPFEEVVVGELKKILGEDAEIIREQQPLRDGKRRFELDVWIPSLDLAFEVQDFATHSKYSDDEMCTGRRFIGPKKGPAYHELKRRLALEQIGVKLYDIWEDAIMDGSYKLQLADAVEAAKASLS